MGGVAVVAEVRRVVGCGRCSWWGTGYAGRWLLVWQAVVGVPLRVPVRESLGVVGEGDRRGAWWRFDGLARPLGTWWRVGLRGRCDGCVLGLMRGCESGEHWKQGVWGRSGGVSVVGVV